MPRGHSAQTEVCLALRKFCRIGEGAELPGDQRRITCILWGRREVQGRGSLQPVVLQKAAQGWTACSHHRTPPAFNKFKGSLYAPTAFQEHPTKILPRNFLLAAVAHRWISLVPYRFCMRVNILNLAFGVQWHAFSQSGWWNLRRLYTIAHLCTSAEVIYSARWSNRP